LWVDVVEAAVANSVAMVGPSITVAVHFLFMFQGLLRHFSFGGFLREDFGVSGSMGNRK
jgi:hypothetical protein